MLIAGIFMLLETVEIGGVREFKAVDSHTIDSGPSPDSSTDDNTIMLSEHTATVVVIKLEVSCTVMMVLLERLLMTFQRNSFCFHEH